MSIPSIESTGFAAPMQDDPARRGSALALIATVALGLSIAVVLIVTMTAARAANLF
jgi:hypothetical protein